VTDLLQAPSLGRRLLCALYDGLLLIAVVMVAAFPFVGLTRALDPGLARRLLQIYVFVVVGLYFTLFWRKGQTLAMKTWKIRMVDAGGTPLGWGRLWLRYILAWANLALFGVGWWAALFRQDAQFLQDHLAGTRLISTLMPPSDAPATTRQHKRRSRS